jgi:hypothetical protein
MGSFKDLDVAADSLLHEGDNVFSFFVLLVG